MADIYYTEEHEWISVENGVATIGITDHAQDRLGDMVFAELPAVGANLSKGDAAATVESVKAASEVYAPIDGEVTEVNDALGDDPSLINASPENDGWFYKMTVANTDQLGELMDADSYKKSIED